VTNSLLRTRKSKRLPNNVCTAWPGSLMIECGPK